MPTSRDSTTTSKTAETLNPSPRSRNVRILAADGSPIVGDDERTTVTQLAEGFQGVGRALIQLSGQLRDSQENIQNLAQALLYANERIVHLEHPWRSRWFKLRLWWYGLFIELGVISPILEPETPAKEKTP